MGVAVKVAVQIAQNRNGVATITLFHVLFEQT
jgi:hypothetical protein